MKSSIIIPTLFSRPIYLEDCLKSICCQKEYLDAVEIIIVDNRPDPHSSISISLPIDAPDLIDLRITHEIMPGLHNARHHGARIANNEFLIYLDDDVIVSDHWLVSILAPFRDETVICVGGKVVPEWETDPPAWIKDLKGNYLSLLNYGEKTIELHFPNGINGCNFAIRKRSLFRFKGFHPDGFSTRDMIWLRGDGEFGLIKKIWQSNGKVIYSPFAEVKHRIPHERINTDRFMYLVKNRSISRGFGYCRNKKCNIFWILLLLLGSIFLFLYFSLTRFLNWAISKNNYLAVINQEIYSTLMQYSLRAISNNSFRKYICKPDYF